MQKLYSVTFSKRNFYIAKNDCHKLKLLQIFPIFAILVTRKKTQIYTVVHVIKLWKLQRIITNILFEFSVLVFFSLSLWSQYFCSPYKLRLTLISQWKPSLKYSSMGGTTGRVLSVSVSDF